MGVLQRRVISPSLKGFNYRIANTGINGVEWALSKLPPRVIRWFGQVMLEAASKRDAFFSTVDARPKALDLNPPRHALIDAVTPEPPGRIALVIHGALWAADDFTVETVRYYQRACPDITLIVSTREDSPVELVDKCRDAGAEVILNPNPAVPGRGNVNYQATSTRAGIERAATLNARFVAKTRSDQRLYGVQVLYGMPALLAGFPLKPNSGQLARLITSSYLTFKYTPFHVSDHFMFGELADMLTFWSPPSDPCDQSREEFEREILSHKTIEGRSRRSAERYLMTEFLRAVEGDPLYTILAWWQVLAARLLIIDWPVLDIYWPKYLPAVARCDLLMNHLLASVPFSFTDWVRLVSSDSSEWQPPEWVLELPATTTAPVRLSELQRDGIGSPGPS